MNAKHSMVIIAAISAGVSMHEAASLNVGPGPHDQYARIQDAVHAAQATWSPNSACFMPSYEEVAKLTIAEGEPADRFGLHVAISEDTVVIGSPADDDLGSQSGSAYVFQRDLGGTDGWGRVAQLLPADGLEGDLFGSGVAIAGDIIVVGAFLDDHTETDAGSAYIFQREAVTPWGELWSYACWRSRSCCRSTSLSAIVSAPP